MCFNAHFINEKKEGKSNHKYEHEFVQRRTRRPFSVPEVETLIHVVKKLGVINKRYIISKDVKQQFNVTLLHS